MLIRIHDRYLLRNFLFALAATVAVLTLLAMVYLLFSELATFIEHEATARQMILYLLYSLPQFIMLVFPFACVTAAYFSLYGMMKHGEVVALLGAGLPLIRIVLPVLVFGVAATAGTGIWSEYVAAGAAREARDLIDNQIERKAIRREKDQGRWLRARKNRIFHARWYDEQTYTLHYVTMQELAEDFSHLSRLIEARSATWKEGDLVFHDCYYRTYEEGREKEAAREDQIILHGIEETPEDFAALQVKPREMNYRQLAEFVHMLESEGESTARYLPELHLKIAFPLSCCILILFAVSGAIKHQEGAPALNLGVLIAVGIGYYSCTIGLLELGRRQILSPLAAAWGTNVLFGVIGAILLVRTNRH
jgi:lipopolysaccharide export system permease protein